MLKQLPVKKLSERQVIEKTKKFVKDTLGRSDSTGHDWLHIQRVLNNALAIGSKEKANMFLVQLGALLHDIADWKFHNGDKDIGPRIAKEWLESLNLSKEVITEVVGIVRDIGFKSSFDKKIKLSKAGQVVQDADRLDAMGAIGIARAFAYGGSKNRAIYDPVIKPKKFKSSEDYRKASSHTINHFYEKLLLLKNLINTKTAKKMAERRHRFMENYLKTFYKEWEGNA
ncbi:MAG: metal dependent phosphohydrolase [Candidatus Doudnabacteria bacterium]|nr:metal dependent phosphohydrolase [Candidatus Doudnabacteria bacterium]